MITPSPGAFDGRLQDQLQLGSDSAKHWPGRDLRGCQSSARKNWDLLAVGVAEEPEVQGGRGQLERQQDAQIADQLADHTQEHHRGSDRGRSHRKTRRYSRPGCRDRSGLFRKPYAQQTSLAAGSRLEPVDCW